MQDFNSPHLIEDFLRRVRITKSLNTYKSYKSAMKMIMESLGDSPLSESVILNIISDWQQSVSINTIKYRLVVLTQYCKFLGMNTDILDSLLEELSSEHTLQPCPTVSEFEKILSKVKNFKYKAILLIMAESGARVSEVVGIDLKDTDLLQGVVVVRDTKNNEDKVIRLSKRAIENIQFYIDKERIDTSDIKLFTSKFGCQTIIATQKQIKKYCMLAGLSKYHCHSFRHYFAQRLIDSNCSLPIVQKAMGHKSSKSTEKYFKVDYGTVFNAVGSVFK